MPADRTTPRRPEDTIAHLTSSLALRLAMGAGQLGALYLATHAIGAFMGWKVMADAESADVEKADETEEDDAEAEADGDVDDEGKTKPPIPTVKTQPDARLTRITRFNVFCPTCAPSEEVVAAAAAAAGLPLPPGLELELEAAELEFPGAVPTQLPIALLATMEAKAPGISLATISQADGTGLYAKGEEVLPAVTLIAIDLGIVYLRNQGRVEYLQVSSDDPPPLPKAVEEDEEGKEEDAPKKPANEIEGASDAITCNGTSCTVERKFVDQLLANPAVLASQGNARPYARDDLKGFRLSRVKSGTLPRMLGLRSGDVITAINGQPLDSLDGAMKLYTKMRNAAHLTIDVTRNKAGERQEIRLDVSIL